MKKIISIILTVSIFLVAGILSGRYFWHNFEKKEKIQEIAVKDKSVKADFSVKDDISESLKTISFITPHHLVAEKMIDEIFVRVSKENNNLEIERIILISPNHFNLGHGWLSVSDKIWETKNGKVEADSLVIEKIKNLEGVNLENEAFQKEHGIENLLPFIAKYFPKTKVIPLMIKDGFPLKKSQDLASVLAKDFSTKTLIILSSDFSHELEKNISEFHNKKAIEAIEDLEYEKVYNLDTDCAPGLVVVMKYTEELGYGNFELLGNSNSSEIYGKNFIGENTSYITGFFSQNNTEKKDKSVHLMFFGDLMLDRYNRILVEKNGVIWLNEKIIRLFWSQDQNILNLEGPITDDNSVSINSKEGERNNFIFTFSPEKTRTFLTENKIGIVNLGNNHILNFGEDGLTQTKNNLENFGVEYFGDPTDEKSFLIKEINGRKIGFVNYNQFSKIDEQKTVGVIREIKKQTDFLVVYTHWGQEYQLVENEMQRNLAHQFIDNGADLIIGTHPHVVQPVEIYKNKVIFYSLGNFVFDQYFSEDVKERLAVGVSISKNKIEFILEPLYMEKNGQVVLADEHKRNKLLKRLVDTSKLEDLVKIEILNGKFSLQN